MESREPPNVRSLSSKREGLSVVIPVDLSHPAITKILDVDSTLIAYDNAGTTRSRRCRWLRETPFGIKMVISGSAICFAFSLVFLSIALFMSEFGSSEGSVLSAFWGDTDQETDTFVDVGSVDTRGYRPSRSPSLWIIEERPDGNESWTSPPTAGPSNALTVPEIPLYPSRVPSSTILLSSEPSPSTEDTSMISNQTETEKQNLSVAPSSMQTRKSSNEPSTDPHMDSSNPTLSPSFETGSSQFNSSTNYPSFSAVPTVESGSPGLPSSPPTQSPSTVHETSHVPSSTFPSPFPSLSQTDATLISTSEETSVTTFYALAGMAEDDGVINLKEPLYYASKEVDFLIHLGDFNKDDNCQESSYRAFSSLLKQTSQCPVFVIPGENEWNGCPDPIQAWSFWNAYFYKFEDNFSPLPFQTFHQEGRRERFSFLYRNVLYIGLTIVGGIKLGDREWSDLHTQNLLWFNQQLSGNIDQTEAIVIFGNHDETRYINQFFSKLAEVIDETDTPVAYIHAGKRWSFQVNALGVTNLISVGVISGSSTFLKVTVDTENAKPFKFSVS